MSAPDLSADDFAATLQALMPPGRAWPRDPNSTQAAVLAGLAPTYSRQTSRANYLLQDAFPATPDELLPEWNSTLKLPDSALPAASTLAAQQAQVKARFANTGGQSAAYFTALAATLGVTVTVESLAPFRVGQSKVGQQLGGDDWHYAWCVHAPDGSLAGLMAELKPGHTIVNIQTP